MSDLSVLLPKWFSHMGGSFWQKDSLITHILFELCLFRNLAQCTFFCSPSINLNSGFDCSFRFYNCILFLIFSPSFQDGKISIDAKNFFNKILKCSSKIRNDLKMLQILNLVWRRILFAFFSLAILLLVYSTIYFRI